MIPQYEITISEEEKLAVNQYMNSGGWLTEHGKTRELEKKIADFLGVKHCSMMPNGTISLSIALLAYGIKPGDRVLVPSLSMIATANAVKFIGAVPVFVEIEKDSLCMNVDNVIKLQEMVANFKGYCDAIIYTTLNGRKGGLDKLAEHCKKIDLPLIADSAQSFGSVSNNAPINSYSFSMPKILTAGQGGALTTNDDELALKIKRLRDFGRDSGGNDVHNHFGINCKYTDLQSVILLEQLKKIDKRIAAKKAIYDIYQELLKEVKQIELIPFKENEVAWFVDIYCDERNHLANYLDSQGIKTRKVYPPMYHQNCYAEDLNYSITERYCSRGLWLPSSLTLDIADIKHVCNTIKDFYKK